MMKLTMFGLFLLLLKPCLAGDIVYKDLHTIEGLGSTSFLLIGETNSDNLKVKENVSPFLKDSKIQAPSPTNFEELRENLERQLERRSGDDVGNGGDHLRQVFYLEMKSVAEFFQFSYPRIEQMIVVDNLGRPLMRTHFKGEDYLLLDRELISHAIHKGRDLRPLMIQTLFPGHKDYLSLYQNLPMSKGRPLCFFDYTHEMEIRIAKDFKGHHETDPVKARELAMKECREKKLKGCFVFSQEQSGFLGTLLHRVVVRGYEVNTKVLNKSERQKLACKAAIQCEELTFSAPFGQVSPEEFSDITALIEENCR
jgi:hypothetical protein